MEEMLSFLAELEANNNREWYHSHVKERKEACAAFRDLVQELIFEIAKFDDRVLFHDPADLIYRIPRDMRIPNQPSPYNPTFRAHIGPKGKQPFPVGYYICIAPNGKSFLGGGISVSSERELTGLLRERIRFHGDELREILDAPDFRKHFALKGAALKNPPKGYDPFSPYADFLRYKCMYAEGPLSQRTLLAKRFPKRAGELFHMVKPFVDFLNDAVGDYTLPSDRG